MATFEFGVHGVSRDNGGPLNVQIERAMRLRIAAGEWPPGHRLKSEPALAEEIGVSRGTLRKGLAALIAEGLLIQVPGSGTFVASSGVAASTQRMSTLAEDMVGQGVEFRTTVRSAGLVRPSAEIARNLELSRHAEVFRLERVRGTEEGPIALLHNYVVAELAPGIEQHDFTRETLFGVLEQDYGLDIEGARRRFDAALAEGETCAALDIEQPAALQHLEQLTFLADGRPVEYSDVWIDSRRLRVVIHLSRHERSTR